MAPWSPAANPLSSIEDLRRNLLDLLSPLEARYADGGLHLGNTGTGYSPRVVLMEGWSRLLWGIGPLLAGGGRYDGLDRHLGILLKGTNPQDKTYWGYPGDTDQRLVEMAAIALTLMIAPDHYWTPLSGDEKENLYRWLSSIEQCALPANNWHFFRILVCAAFRTLGLPVNTAAETESFDLVESCYKGDGWYVDGSSGNYDLYNPLGFHFYGLVYAKLAGSKNPERAARYLERARLFAPQFLAYFREDGSIVPYGRSLTYRFGAVSFFSACAFADEEVLPWGVVKGVVLRHLRWWNRQPILDAAGILSVGYAYPNLVMAEQYNSPGSPYWGLKAYLVLALGGDHPFWRTKEAPLPPIPHIVRIGTPKYIISRGGEDVQLLSPGRYPAWEAVHAAAKYCKFAYSARFGFSVSHGAAPLEKTGCDSSLVLSEGDDYWRERRHTESQACGPNWTYGRWKPWQDVEIETLLVALGAWHVRFHRIRSPRLLQAVEGGFAVPRFHGTDHPTQGIVDTTISSAITLTYPWAASRIVALEGALAGEKPREQSRVADILVLEPNLNVLHASASVPVLRGTAFPGETLWICAVRAGDADSDDFLRPPRLEEDPWGSLVLYDGAGNQAVALPPKSLVPKEAPA